MNKKSLFIITTTRMNIPITISLKLSMKGFTQLKIFKNLKRKLMQTISYYIIKTFTIC